MPRTKQIMCALLGMAVAGMLVVAAGGCASADGTAAISLPSEDGGGPAVKVAGGHDSRDGDDGASWHRRLQR